jgi:hypothetical protein
VVMGPPGRVCSAHGTHSFKARAGHFQEGGAHLWALGPAAGAVVHAGDFDCPSANAVGDDVGRFRDDEFARSGDATRCSEPRIFREEIFDAIQNVESDAPCGGRVMLGDVRAQ